MFRNACSNPLSSFFPLPPLPPRVPQSFLSTQAAKLAKELSICADSLKKESALRKKYKNDLEDMKGAIRVYARCRPMAKYENERGCHTGTAAPLHCTANKCALSC